MTTKSIIWNKLKALGYESKQLKAVYNVSYQSASKELLESILEQLQKEVGQGVKEDLSSCDGGATVATVKENEVNSSEVYVKKLTPKQLKQRFTDSNIYCEKLGSKYQVQFNTSSSNSSKIYTYSVNNYALIDLAEKFEIVTADEVKAYRNNDNRCYKVSEPVNLALLKEEKTSNPDMSPESLLCHCVDKYGWNANDVFEVVYSLFNQSEVNVATVTSDNITEFKGIAVEHFDNVTEYINSMAVQMPINEFNGSVTLINGALHKSSSLTPMGLSNNFYLFHDGKVKSSQSLVSLIKTVKEWLATEDEKIQQAITSNQVHQYAAVLGGQQQNQVSVSEPLPGSVVLSPKHYLKPKMYLFAAMTDFVFLLSGFLDLMDLFDTSAQYASEFNIAVTKMYQMWEATSYILHGCYTSPKQISFQDHCKFVDYWKQVSSQIA